MAVAKGGAPAKGGPPSSTPAYVPEPKVMTPFEKLIDMGTEFILGPPPGINKTYNAHRDVCIPKLAPRIEIYAKKLREMYIREGTLREQKVYIDYVRMR